MAQLGVYMAQLGVHMAQLGVRIYGSAGCAQGMVEQLSMLAEKETQEAAAAEADLQSERAVQIEVSAVQCFY